MTTYSNPRIYQDLLSWAQRVVQNSPHQVKFDGEPYGQPGQDIIAQHNENPESGGKLEVKLLLPAASEAFEWLAEITLDAIEAGEYKHYLVRKSGDIVETYGKQVIPVGDNDAFKLLERLQKLTATAA